MQVRSTELEILDNPDISRKSVLDSLNFMVWVNRYFGGTAVILNYFKENLTQDKFSVLDLGSGSGDIPQALSMWSKKNGKSIKITALDTNPICR